MKKRVLIILMAVVMVIGLLPATVLAEKAAAENNNADTGDLTVYAGEDNSASPDYSWYGDGSADTYVLNDLEDLLGFSNIVNGTAETVAKDSFAAKTVSLNKDIDLTGIVWTPIGSSMYDHVAAEDTTKKFEGTFDGGNHTITGLSSSGYVPLSEDVGPSKEYSFGLFGYAYGANIKNVKLAGVSIECCDAVVDTRTASGSGIAALVGYYVPKSGTASIIENCHVLGGTVVASNNMGGLIGYLQVHGRDNTIDVTVKGCSNAAAVTTEARDAGGILGLAQQMHRSNIGSIKFENCTNTGNITAKNGGSCAVAGGILGQENTDETHGTMQLIFDSCRNSGTIKAEGEGTSEVHASGIGTAYYNTGPWNVAKNCVNTGDVIITGNAPDNFAGGIFAYGPYATLENCTNTGTIIENDVDIGNVLIDKVYYRLYLNEMESSSVSGTNFSKFMLNGGFTPRPRVREDNNVYYMPDPVRTGYVFGGWYGNESLEGEPTTTFNNGSTYYAKWSPVSYTVNFDPNGGTGAEMAPQNFVYDTPGEKLLANTYTREHFTFDGWNTAADGSGDSFEDQKVMPNVTGDREATLYAQWKGDEYDIVYEGMAGAVQGANHPIIHTYNTATAVPNPTKPGYVFAGWKINGGEIAQKNLTLGATDYTEEITLCATWTPAELTGMVSVTGTAQAGKTLTATLSGSNNTGDLRYQWYRYKEESAAISGATRATYTVTSADVQSMIYCVVKSSIQTGELVSEKTAMVTPQPVYPGATVVPVAPSEVKNPFVDVAATHYSYDAVMWAIKEGITEGTSETTFSPNASCTRAQMVTFLWRAAGCPEPISKVCPFADVDADSYYAKAVLWAMENGITNGTSETAFSPAEECSRAQMAVFLCRMADGKPTGDADVFSDVKADAYYAESVQWVYESGITKGTGENTFEPDAVCTRAQMVTFLYRHFVK